MTLLAVHLPTRQSEPESDPWLSETTRPIKRLERTTEQMKKEERTYRLKESEEKIRSRMRGDQPSLAVEAAGLDVIEVKSVNLHLPHQRDGQREAYVQEQGTSGNL
ncbi:hypothetical protein V6N11_063326 [Hibiscus sabdariffa]|uniref:Uncharacterized protein n=1 Tax=Hibiscus sabdariffa TaxID=183260 RepID=A0ABR2AH18_9ROSI